MRIPVISGKKKSVIKPRQGAALVLQAQFEVWGVLGSSWRSWRGWDNARLYRAAQGEREEEREERKKELPAGIH